MKTHLNITIDTDVFIKCKLNEEINVSKECNKFLKKLLGNDDIKTNQIKKEVKNHENELIVLKQTLKKREEFKKERQLNDTIEQQKEQKEALDKIPTGKGFTERLERERIFKEQQELKQLWLEAQE